MARVYDLNERGVQALATLSEEIRRTGTDSKIYHELKDLLDSWRGTLLTECGVTRDEWNAYWANRSD